jgi:hypothetical protein
MLPAATMGTHTNRKNKPICATESAAARRAPDVRGPAIARQRENAMEEIDAALAGVDTGARFTSYATATDDRGR